MSTDERNEKTESIDIVTFSRIIKVLAIFPKGINETELEHEYKELNFALIPSDYKLHQLVNHLVHHGWVEKVQFQNQNHVSYLIPTEKCEPFFANIRLMEDSSVYPKKKKPARALEARLVNKIPLLEVPTDVLKSKYAPVILQDIAYPHHIRFQLKGPNHSEALDSLIAEMTAFYSNKEIRVSCAIPKGVMIFNPSVVAAPFSREMKYNRALVLDTVPSTRLSVFFLDFGNTVVCDRDQLFYLKDEFMILPSQAISGCISSLCQKNTKEDKMLSDAAIKQIGKFSNLSAIFKHKFDAADPHWPDSPIELEIEENDTGKNLTIKNIIGEFFV